jgi:negative regulator of sigma E activity
MNDKDLRDCFAMFALAGAVMNGKQWNPEDLWDIADAMLEARNKETVGLPAIKKRVRK